MFDIAREGKTLKIQMIAFIFQVQLKTRQKLQQDLVRIAQQKRFGGVEVDFRNLFSDGRGEVIHQTLPQVWA